MYIVAQNVLAGSVYVGYLHVYKEIKNLNNGKIAK